MDEETLIVALNEAPAEVRPRMAYAAWLEQRGDPRFEYFRAEQRLRTTPLGDGSRRELGRTWRALRAQMDPQWLSRVDLGAPIPAWVARDARRPPQAGLEDWHRWASRSHYEWVILAALAPIEPVVRIVIETGVRCDPDSALASGLWRRGVPVVRGKQYDSGEPGIPFVQLKEHAWTVALYDTFDCSIEPYHAAQDDARALSDRLGTLAVAYWSEDTSANVGYYLFECGELIEFAESGPGRTEFASKRRPLPWSTAPRDFPDEVFQALGLYIPSLFPVASGVRLDDFEPGAITRADRLDRDWDYEETRPPDVTQNEAGFAEIHHLYEHGSDRPPECDDVGYDEDIPF